MGDPEVVPCRCWPPPKALNSVHWPAAPRANATQPFAATARQALQHWDTDFCSKVRRTSPTKAKFSSSSQGACGGAGGSTQGAAPYTASERIEPLPCAPACLCTAHCGHTGCLFKIEKDPTEHHDVASSNLAIARKMLARVVLLNDTRVPPTKGGLYNPVRGTVQPAACAKAMGEYRGFWGPWME